MKPFIPEPQPDEEIYNEVERSYDVRPEPSQVYERSATVQDSLESESIAAPAEQRDIEAAVAAGAAGYAGVKQNEKKAIGCMTLISGILRRTTEAFLSDPWTGRTQCLQVWL